MKKRDCNNGAVRNAGKGRYREGENRGPLTWTNFPEGKNALRAATGFFTEGCSPCRASARKTERLPRAKNEIWYLGSQTPSGGWRATTRVDVPAA